MMKYFSRIISILAKSIHLSFVFIFYNLMNKEVHTSFCLLILLKAEDESSEGYLSSGVPYSSLT